MTTSAFVERRRLRVRLALTLSTILCSGLAAPAFAQSAPPAPFANVDGNGVDLTTGAFTFSLTEGSIGDANGGVSLQRIWAGGAGWVNNWSGGAYQATSGTTTVMKVELGAISDTFSISGSTYVSQKANGATLVDTGDGHLLYTASDGTQITFLYQYQDGGEGVGIYKLKGSACRPDNATGCSIPISIRRPDGMTFTLTWDFYDKCTQVHSGDCYVGISNYRFKGVTSSANYQFTIAYASDSPGTGNSPVAAWLQRSSVTFTNLSSAPATLPTVTYAYPSSTVTNVTDIGGRTWRFTTLSDGRLSAIKRPSASSDTTAISYGTNGVSSLTSEGVTTGYSQTISGTTGTIVATDALSNVTTVVSDLTKGRPTSVTDALAHVTAFEYDSNSRLTKQTSPENNFVQYSYDARGNVTQTLLRDKSGTSANDLVSSASFDSSCTNIVKCNKPNSVTDARGNTTSYTYDATHGGVLSVTAPAATTGAVQPQVRYSYTQYTAATGYPVYMLTGVSACATTSSCSGTSGEVKTTATYETGNLLPATTSAGDGTGALTATTTLTFDKIGNVSAVDGPLSGTADTTTYRYDSARQRVGVISADPDGVGSLKRRAVRTTYNVDGQPTMTEAGTVNGVTDSDWSAFTSAQQSNATYDGNGRKTKDTVTAGGTTYGVSQYSYDAVGRLQCSALRMNSATWSSLPTSACTLGATGSAGPDRIAKTTYDALGRPSKSQSAYGTSDQSDDATGLYTTNGKLGTLTDANGNTTTYDYDGFDRLSKTRYPSPTTAGTSSTTDYEQLVYDANSNATSRRLRGYASDSTQHIDYSYDALNRLTLKDLPGSEPDVSYTYDLLSRPLSAATSSKTLSFTYDALSRNLTQTSPFGTTTSAYDLAGRRTSFVWQDGFYVTYDYLVTGEPVSIRENAASSGIGVLATFGYDDLGRRTSLTRGNGTTVTYTPDAISRLSSLVQDLSGTTNDLTLGFSYNPAGQIASTTRSNDSYAWSGAANRNDASSVNGLNQVTSVGAGSLGYDVRGNLNSSGSNSYTYSSENLLLTGPSSATLYYDPLMRLYQESGGSIATTLFQYDGQATIGEYDSSGTLQKRYVHGPGSDEPLVEYDKSGSTFTRAWLHADERGSVIAQSNDSGVSTSINAYDEYGVPGASNAGRFGYTGQAWLPSLGVWYYKARMYSSRLGRFMQTDPIGYGDGMNWYGYVGGDPVNGADPSGLDCEHDELYADNGQPCTIEVTARSTGPSGMGSLTFGYQTGVSFAGAGGGAQPAMGANPSVLPQNAQPECEYKDASGQCVLVPDGKGGLKLSPKKQEKACQDYAKMMQSNREVSRYTGGASQVNGARGLAQKASGSKLLATPLAFDVVMYAAGLTTYLLGQTPPPPGCQK